MEVGDIHWFIGPTKFGIITFGIGLGGIIIYAIMALAACVADAYFPFKESNRTFSELLQTFLAAIPLLWISGICHEFGHAAAASLVNGTVQEIHLTIVDDRVVSIVSLQDIPLIAYAGPCIEAALALVLILWPQRLHRSRRMIGLVMLGVALYQLLPLPGSDGSVAQNALMQLGMR